MVDLNLPAIGQSSWGDEVLAAFEALNAGKPDTADVSATYVPLARPLSIAAIGDSITDGGNVGGIGGSVGRTGGIVVFSPTSYLGWALLHTAAPVRYEGVWATSSYTTAQVLATHVPSVLAADPAPGYCLVLAGSNDAGSVAIADTIANLTSIYTQLRAAGVEPICATIPPNGAGPVADNTDQLAINAWITKYAQDNHLPLVDFYAALVEPSTGAYQTAFDSGDNTHPSAAGARAMGIALGAVLDAAVRAGDAGLVSSNLNGAAQLLTNPALTTDTGPDEVPDGWGALAGIGDGTIDLSASADVAGHKWTVTRGTTADMLFRSPTFTLVSGNRMRVGFMFRGTAAAGGRYTLRLDNSAGSTLVGLTDFAASTAEVVPMVWEFDVPAGLADYTGFHFDLYVQTGAGSAVEVGQITVLDLTALGIA